MLKERLKRGAYILVNKGNFETFMEQLKREGSELRIKSESFSLKEIEEFSAYHYIDDCSDWAVISLHDSTIDISTGKEDGNLLPEDFKELYKFKTFKLNPWKLGYIIDDSDIILTKIQGIPFDKEIPEDILSE